MQWDFSVAMKGDEAGGSPSGGEASSLAADGESMSWWKAPACYGLAFAFTNAMTWMIVLGTPLVLLCEALGCSAAQVGLAYAAVFLALPVQVLATALLPRWGYRRQVLIAWTWRAIFLITPLALAWSAPENPPRWMPVVMIVSTFAFCFTRAIGSSCVFPWMCTIIPQRWQGQFFAGEQAAAGISGMLTMTLAAVLLAQFEMWTGFVMVYLFALLGSATAVWSLYRLPDGPKPQGINLRMIVTSALPLCLRPGRFRHYLALLLAMALVNNAYAPFSTLYLRSVAEWSQSSILLLANAQVAGSILAAWFLRQIADRFGARPLMFWSLLGYVLVYGGWLLVVVAGAGVPGWVIALLSALGGASSTLAHLSNLSYFPSLSDADQRPYVTSLLTSITGLIGGASPIIWGYFLGGASGSVSPERLALFFGVAALMQVALIYPLWRLPPPPLLGTWPKFRGIELLRPHRTFHHTAAPFRLTRAPFSRSPGKPPAGSAISGGSTSPDSPLAGVGEKRPSQAAGKPSAVEKRGE